MYIYIYIVGVKWAKNLRKFSRNKKVRRAISRRQLLRNGTVEICFETNKQAYCQFDSSFTLTFKNTSIGSMQENVSVIVE